MEFTYLPKTLKQLKVNYSSRRVRDKDGFRSFENFRIWYDKAPKVCYYCGLTEEESQEIVSTGLLTSNRFPLNGKPSQGRGRGMWLEVDLYSEENAVLCCYFCNNDKSDIFNDIEYKKFFQNRVVYLRNLLKEKTSK